MRPLVAIICLLAIACNTALAATGGIAYCIEKGPNGRISLACVQDPLDRCCDKGSPGDAEESHVADCETCLDARIDGDGQESAAWSNGDRAAHKAPIAVEWQAVALFETASEPFLRLTVRPAHAPPPPSGAWQQFADTVTFRL